MADKQELQDLGWCVVELMGHRKLGAHVIEAEIAGAGFLRLEVPSDPPATQFVAPGAIYALTPTTEAMVKRMAAACRVEPVHRYELPAPPAPPESDTVGALHDIIDELAASIPLDKLEPQQVAEIDKLLGQVHQMRRADGEQLPPQPEPVEDDGGEGDEPQDDPPI